MNYAIGVNAPAWLCVDSPSEEERDALDEDYAEPEPSSGKPLDEDCYRQGRRE